MQAASAHTLFSHWPLLRQLIARDVSSRYRGSMLGLLWLVLTPLLLLAVYTFVFTVVFKARWPLPASAEAPTSQIALLLFSGLLIHGFLAECLTRSASVIAQHASFVKKVVFPLEILPLMLVGSALFHLFMGLIVLLTASLIVTGALPLTILLLPLILLPFLLLAMGLAWILASLGVFLRDLGQIIGLLMTVLLFLSPVFYPVEALPEMLRPFLYINPLTFIVEQTRAVLLLGLAPDWTGLGLYTLVSLLIYILGLRWFTWTRGGFADVL